MPLYEFECPDCGNREEHWLEVRKRNEILFCANEDCDTGIGELQRLPGGHKMLHFEEGRGRVHIGLSDKPITSYAQQKKMMKDRGAVEGGNTVPKSVASNPKSIGLKEFMSKDRKGKWL